MKEIPSQLTNNQQCMMDYNVPQYNDRPYVVHVCLMQLNRKIKSLKKHIALYISSSSNMDVCTKKNIIK